MEHFDIDAYSPARIAERVEKAAHSKANLDWLVAFLLAVMAGVYISFGALLYTCVIHDSSLSYGLTKLIGGVVFCLGLILVVIAGAELFTGNNLLVLGCLTKKISPLHVLRNWTIVFLGNFAGSLLVVWLISMSGHWATNNWAVGAKAVEIANAKVNLGFGQAVSRGILCNMLVCLAVWLCFGARSVADKITAIIFPITAFVVLGFEHSVANMYFVPAGLILKSDEHIKNITGSAIDISHLTFSNFLLANLLPVTIGNIIGGGILIGAVYWAVYLRRRQNI